MARLARRIASFPADGVLTAKRVLNELTMPAADAIRADAVRFRAARRRRRCPGPYRRPVRPGPADPRPARTRPRRPPRIPWIDVNPPHSIELRHLRYFVALADAGSFTQAAERIFVAQPTLSQQIRLPRQAVTSAMTRVELAGHPLTATAAVIWNGSLPRPLPQILFDAAENIISAAPDQPAVSIHNP